MLRAVLKYSLAAGAMGLAVFAPRLYLEQVLVIEPLVDELTTQHVEQLSLFTEMNQHLTTLASLVFPALGVLLGFAGSPGPQGSDRRLLAGLSAGFAGLSLYCGYLAHEAVLWMLEAGFFRLSHRLVQVPMTLQFMAFILAVFFLGDLAIRATGDRRPEHEDEDR
ncbi:MAG: hypothetical protein AAGC60_21345 [Acidobacteriota bacterium]